MDDVEEDNVDGSRRKWKYSSHKVVELDNLWIARHGGDREDAEVHEGGQRSALNDDGKRCYRVQMRLRKGQCVPRKIKVLRKR